METNYVITNSVVMLCCRFLLIQVSKNKSHTSLHTHMLYLYLESSVLPLITHLEVMAEAPSPFEAILKKKFKPFPIEKSVYVNTKAKGNNPELYAKYICDALQDGDVPDDLIKLYQEAVYGKDPKVKERIYKRMYFLSSKTR